MDDQLRKLLFDAGGAAVRFNSPLGLDRAHALVDTLGRLGASSVVDLGCGRGDLARIAGARLHDAHVVGVDNAEALIVHARQQATEAGLAGRITFEVSDATEWSASEQTGIVDAAICIGASHVFGGPAGLFEHLATLVPHGSAIVGDGFWQAEPSEWCLTELGEMPRSIDELNQLASSTGWTIESSETSTLAEWDEFEHGWTGGVRRLRSPEAVAFADSRLAEYDNYRGILGFAWLILSR